MAPFRFIWTSPVFVPIMEGRQHTGVAYTVQYYRPPYSLLRTNAWCCAFVLKKLCVPDLLRA